MTSEKEAEKGIVSLLAILVLAGAIFLGAIANSPSALGIFNNSIKTYVNVTNTEPHPYDMILSPYPTLDLSPGNLTTITCNVSVWDYNGFRDVKAMNGTLFWSGGGYKWDSPDDNRTHYSNLSCLDCVQIAGDTLNGSCQCKFAVQYYAQNGTWTCNVSINDKTGLLPTEVMKNFSASRAKDFNITPLVAIDTPSSIFFGNLTVTQTSTPKILNITNIGNRDINISIYGFGGDNETIGQNLSMICPYGNMSITEQRYAFAESPTYAAMFTYNSSMTRTNITVPRITNYTQPFNVTNVTYWRLHIPLSVGGYCNGTLIVLAEDSLLHD